MYLGMVDLNKTQSVDVDLPLYCAFSFPAVLQTLGPNHWSLLKPTFDILSTDMQVSHYNYNNDDILHVHVLTLCNCIGPNTCMKFLSQVALKNSTKILSAKCNSSTYIFGAIINL